MHKTDRRVLFKGVKYLGFALPLMFAGPIIIYSSFKNQQHPLYYAVLGFGILCCISSMFLFFKGIQTIMKSLFGK